MEEEIEERKRQQRERESKTQRNEFEPQAARHQPSIIVY